MIRVHRELLSRGDFIPIAKIHCITICDNSYKFSLYFGGPAGDRSRIIYLPTHANFRDPDSATCVLAGARLRLSIPH